MEKGIAQNVIAQKLGKRPDWVCRVESGDYVVPGDLLPAYAKALGVSVAHLFLERAGDGSLAQAG